mgnify:CR=1 FL=1
MRRRKLERRLERDFGRVPDPFYSRGDMELIRSYYDYRRKMEPNVFLIDDITWNDLELDRVFRRLNPGLSASGEQYLYYMLRSPSQDAETYRERRELIALMEGDPSLRLKLQVLLSILGCSRRDDFTQAFSPEARGKGWLFCYLLLALLAVAALVFFAFVPQWGALPVFGAFSVNGLVHELRKRRVQRDFDAVNYSIALITALHRMRKLREPALDRQLERAYQNLERLRTLARVGGVASVSDNGRLEDVPVTLFLLDLIVYEYSKNKLWRRKEDVFAVHETVGRIDAAIAIASYRASVPNFAEPDLDFDGRNAYYCALDMTHPLLEKAVPNDLNAARPVLVTGSNASGKSTYLKTAALCALLAQSICTCPARKYTASAFRIFSSMALRDDMLAGESYFIVETRSLGRILTSAASPGRPVFCVIDEVLRGTNTVERVAASSVILDEAARRGLLCLAATHDLELCSLLEEGYDLCHFEETPTEDGIAFDYRVHAGPTKSRNAIELLRQMGFPDTIVEKAHARADHYSKTGIWK